MKTALIASLAAGATAGNAPSFGDWSKTQSKAYASKEELVLRRSVYAANVAKINKHNASGAGFSMSVNKFADLTGEEFKARYASGLKKNPLSTTKGLLGKVPTKAQIAATPASIDWVSKGAVTPVKNQGQCGSCWAFSTTGGLEGATFVSTGKLVSLSEQQLVDCSGSAGNQGCNGGLMDDAFGWIKTNGGLCSEAAYPYTGTDGTCHACTSIASVASFTDVTPNNDAALTAAVAQQPVSIAVEADQSSFQFYSSGVMTAACGTSLDHGVLAVGYDSGASTPYWKVKNSWGADWGMSGYILLGKGASYNSGAGQCGIMSQPSWPTYAAPGPEPTIAPQPSGSPSHDSTTTGGPTDAVAGSTTSSGGSSGGSSGVATANKLATKIRATKH